MSMTGYDYNFDLAIREVGKQAEVTNNLGRTALYGEIVYLDGIYGIVMEYAGIANDAKGRIAMLDSDIIVTTAQINATDTFGVGRPIYFLAGSSSAAGTLEDSAASGAVAIGTITAEQGSAGAMTAISFRPYSQIVDYGGYNTRLTAVEGVVASLADDPGIPFRKTVTLKSADATTPVSIIADADVGTGKSVYITSMYANVNGEVAWSGDGNNVIIRDRAADPVAAITMADATALGANSQLVFGSTGVTLGDGIKDGTGMTATKGIEIVGDGAFSAGSDLIVTICGFIGDSPA
jgi:hypothetical protein